VRIPQLALLSERRLDSAARPIREKGQHALFRRDGGRVLPDERAGTGRAQRVRPARGHPVQAVLLADTGRRWDRDLERERC
jgi:hypothetical protein